MTNITLLYEDGEKVKFEASADKTILDAAESAGFALANDCCSGQCRTCLARLRSGHIDWPKDFVANLSDIEVKEGYVLPCIARARTDIEVALPFTRQALLPVRERTASVVTVEPASPNVFRLVLKTPPKLPPIRFLAGQYVALTLPGGEVRQYSMSNTSGGHELEFFVRRIVGGAMSSWLETCRPGDTLKLRGPLGVFYRRRDVTSSVLVAGGTGLAPILSILRDMLNSGPQQIRVFAGVTRQADLFGLKVLTELCADLKAAPPRFAMLEPESGWTGVRGTVCEALDDQAAEVVNSGGRAYVCGPPRMTEVVLNWFARRGASLDRVHFEAFSPAEMAG